MATEKKPRSRVRKTPMADQSVNTHREAFPTLLEAAGEHALTLSRAGIWNMKL